MGLNCEAAGVDGYCKVHKSIQMLRKQRNGEWKRLMTDCPLCSYDSILSSSSSSCNMGEEKVPTEVCLEKSQSYPNTSGPDVAKQPEQLSPANEHKNKDRIIETPGRHHLHSSQGSEKNPQLPMDTNDRPLSCDVLTKARELTNQKGQKIDSRFKRSQSADSNIMEQASVVSKIPQDSTLDSQSSKSGQSSESAAISSSLIVSKPLEMEPQSRNAHFRDESLSEADNAAGSLTQIHEKLPETKGKEKQRDHSKRRGSEGKKRNKIKKAVDETQKKASRKEHKLSQPRDQTNNGLSGNINNDDPFRRCSSINISESEAESSFTELLTFDEIANRATLNIWREVKVKRKIRDGRRHSHGDSQVEVVNDLVQEKNESSKSQDDNVTYLCRGSTHSASFDGGSSYPLRNECSKEIVSREDFSRDDTIICYNRESRPKYYRRSNSAGSKTITAMSHMYQDKNRKDGTNHQQQKSSQPYFSRRDTFPTVPGSVFSHYEMEHEELKDYVRTFNKVPPLQRSQKANSFNGKKEDLSLIQVSLEREKESMMYGYGGGGPILSRHHAEHRRSTSRGRERVHNYHVDEVDFTRNLEPSRRRPSISRGGTERAYKPRDINAFLQNEEISGGRKLRSSRSEKPRHLEEVNIKTRESRWKKGDIEFYLKQRDGSHNEMLDSNTRKKQSSNDFKENSSHKMTAGIVCQAESLPIGEGSIDTNHFDSRGRCVRHPNIRLRKKRITGGWKILSANCPECCYIELQRLRVECFLAREDCKSQMKEPSQNRCIVIDGDETASIGTLSTKSCTLTNSVFSYDPSIESDSLNDNPEGILRRHALQRQNSTSSSKSFGSRKTVTFSAYDLVF